MPGSPKLAPIEVTRKLDLACGQRPEAGFEGVDIWSGAQHVVDLQQYPWPFEDSSVLELRCSHYAEHIPMEMVNGKDALFAFFDECHRILVPEGWMTVIVPCGRSNRGFQDPTHRRFFVAETFLYFSAEWRKLNMLDHYNVACNFGIDVSWTVPQEVNLLHTEAQARHFNNYWNTIYDFVARLKAIK